jgi:hypothetical protein
MPRGSDPMEPLTATVPMYQCPEINLSFLVFVLQ